MECLLENHHQNIWRIINWTTIKKTYNGGPRIGHHLVDQNLEINLSTTKKLKKCQEFDHALNNYRLNTFWNTNNSIISEGPPKGHLLENHQLGYHLGDHQLDIYLWAINRRAINKISIGKLLAEFCTAQPSPKQLQLYRQFQEDHEQKIYWSTINLTIYWSSIIMTIFFRTLMLDIK